MSNKLPVMPTQPLEDMADYVRRIRAENKLTVQDVNDRSGGEFDKSYVSLIENRHMLGWSLSVKKLCALANGLGVPPEVLFAVARGKLPGGTNQLDEVEVLEFYRNLTTEHKNYWRLSLRLFHQMFGIKLKTKLREDKMLPLEQSEHKVRIKKHRD